MKRNLHGGSIAAALAVGMGIGSALCAYKSTSSPSSFTVSRVVLEEALDAMTTLDETDLHHDARYALDKVKQVDAKYSGSYLETAKSNLIRVVYSDEAAITSSNDSLKTFARQVIADNLRGARTDAYAVENNRSGSWALPMVPLGLGTIGCAYISFGLLTGRLRQRRDVRDAGP